jgi:hypothetical protein
LNKATPKITTSAIAGFAGALEPKGVKEKEDSFFSRGNINILLQSPSTQNKVEPYGINHFL